MKFKEIKEGQFHRPETYVKDLDDSTDKYWSNTGKYSKVYHELYDKLVPGTGKADTIEGEVLRAASKIYYRHFNDGDYFSQSSFDQLRPFIGSVSSYDDLAEKAVLFVLNSKGNYHPNEHWDSLERMDYGPDPDEEDDGWDDDEGEELDEKFIHPDHQKELDDPKTPADRKAYLNKLINSPRDDNSDDHEAWREKRAAALKGRHYHEIDEGMFGPADYKGWKYNSDVEEYDDNRKIFHSATKDGKEVSMDWSPYSKPTDEEFKLWVDLGMPTREDVDSRGPLDKDDLLSLADKSGLKGLLKNSDKELDEIKHLSGILQDDLYNYNKEDPYNSTFSPKVGIGSMTLRGWKNTMVDRVEDLLSRLNRAKDNLDQDILWQGIHKILKGYNLDIIAQEIELAHEVLEKERSKGGIRSKAFTKDKTFEETKKDACYHKVKSRYKIWPSAYASGALVKCRKVGAKNWGNKSK